MIKKNSRKILYKKQTHNRCTFSVSHIFVWLLSSPLPRSHFLLWPTARARTPLVGCCSCFRPEWSRNTHVETKTKKAKSILVFENPNQTRERIEQKKKKLCKIFQTRYGAQRFHSRFPNVKKNVQISLRDFPPSRTPDSFSPESSLPSPAAAFSLPCMCDC